MNPLTSNAQTLYAYNHNVSSYIQGTPQEVSGSVQAWIDHTLTCIPFHATILEIGSAFGRDAAYIESKGHPVDRSDAADNFVNFLQEQGHNARHFNVLTDPLPVQYDLIFANAVFLHFKEEELHHVLNKVYNGLHPQGILSFSVKLGEGEEWTEEKVGAPRYFRYWQPQPLQDIVVQHGFEIFSTTCDGKFIQIIARKV